MFDFESDHADKRFAPPNKDQNQPRREPPERTVVNQNPVSTRQNNRPVPSANSSIPMPPPAPQRAASARDRIAQRRDPNAKKRNDWAWVVIAAALIMVFIVVGVSLAALLNVSGQTSPGLEVANAPVPTAVDARVNYPSMNGSAGQELKLDDGSSIILQPWNGTTRLNLLLMGIDRRPNQTGLGYRTDTMMLISFDPNSKQLGILSIPRDLYVHIPGYAEPQRINTALALGELQGPGKGATLAMQTVQGTLGMGVNAYVIVDFVAVTKLVDAIGGIDIDVPEPIADYQFPDNYNGYDPLIIKAGLQHMDGNTAQKYARTRHGDNDFERAHRQQLVLFAIRDKLLSMNTLPQLIVQAPSLYGSLSQDVYTQLSVQQIIQLGLWLKDIPATSIHAGVMDQNYVSNYTTPDGAEVLILNTKALPTLLSQVFGGDYNQ